MLEDTLNKIADKILHLDEASLVSLFDRYYKKMEHVEISKDWERSVIVFFLINAVRAKNQKLNDYIMKQQNGVPNPPARRQQKKPVLRLVKTDPSS